MKIIAGLGNPGREYEGTRHNIGFRVVDEVARRLDVTCNRKRFKSLFCFGVIGGEKCALVKPQKYMNLSGDAVWPAIEWFGSAVEELLVVCDDFHLPLGKLRIRRTGSSGGHKGMQSIIEALGTDQFPRLRIGIGEGGTEPPAHGDRTEFVLSRFRKGELETVDEAVVHAADAVETWVREGIEACMNRFN